jgi:nucleoside-diphosphate-sugar epimerase
MSSGKRVVVTGGSGLIGTSVVKKLLARGDSVVIIDRKRPRVDGARFVFADLRDRQFIQPVFEGADAVLHLGEIPNVDAGESPHAVYTTNVAIGSTVLQTASDLRIARVVYTSTCQVYGLWGNHFDTRLVRPTRYPIDEAQPLHPLNTYALSKAHNEHYAKYLAEKEGLSVAAFRFPAVMPEDHAARWIRWLKREANAWKHSMDGFWTFVHGNDAADAYLAAIDRPRAGFEAYHFVAPDVLGTVPLSQRLADERYAPWPTLPSDWPELAAPVTCQKAAEHLGWTPRHTFAELASQVE